jgi:RTX calcium-binding nonapeptide repeat (4 copies)
MRPARRGAVLLLASMLLLATSGIASAAPPANDDFADAEVVNALPYADTRDTSDATSEPDEPSLADLGCGFIGATVWYSFTPSADTVVAADTVGSDYDTILAVWTGSELSSLSLVGCADDSRAGLHSSVPFLAEAGVEYHIQVGGFVAQGGALSFRLRETTAGYVQGTVTEASTAEPLEGICVFVIDAVFRNSNFGVTAADGTYTIAARPGNYVVGFLDCRRDAYVQEFWNDVATDADATEIDVTDGAATPGISPALAPACPGWGTSGRVQVVGTPGADVLSGTSAADVVCGFGGDDILRGGAGRDVLFGGGGHDTLRGNDGGDFLLGDRGRDAIFGGAGRDELTGGPGRDTCVGGRDRDRGSCEVERGIER